MNKGKDSFISQRRAGTAAIERRVNEHVGRVCHVGVARAKAADLLSLSLSLCCTYRTEVRELQACSIIYYIARARPRLYT